MSVIHYSLFSFNRLRNINVATVNTTKAPAEVAITSFHTCLIGDSNNIGIEIIKMAPVKPIPRIVAAKILFIKSPLQILTSS